MFKAIGWTLAAMAVVGTVFVAYPEAGHAVREVTLAPVIRSLVGFEGEIEETEAEAAAREMLSGGVALFGNWTRAMAGAGEKVAAGTDPALGEAECPAETAAFATWASELLPVDVVCYEVTQ